MTDKTTIEAPAALKGEEDDPGMAYLQVPYTMNMEEEKAILTEARRRMKFFLEKETNDEGWSNRVNLKGVKVWSAKDPNGSAFDMTKGVTAMPEGITLEFIRDQMLYEFRNGDGANKFFHRADPMTQRMTIVTKVQHKELLDKSKHEDLSILWGSLYVAPLFNDRDFCFVGHSMETTCPVTGEDIFVSSSFSIEHPAVPDMYDSVSRIRAEMDLTGYIFRPIPGEQDNNNNNRLSMTYTCQGDPKGFLPASVVNLVSLSQAMNVGRVRDMYQGYLDAARCMGANAPLEQYDVARRGGSVTHSIFLRTPKDEVEEEMGVGAGIQTTFDIHLCAYAEHAISVQFQKDSSVDGSSLPYTLRCTKKDDTQGAELLAGKSVQFGGKHHHVLSITFEVMMEDSSKPQEIKLKFNNHGWRKNTLFVPAGCPPSKRTSVTEVPVTEEDPIIREQ